MVDAIAKELSLDSLKFSTIETLVESIGLPKCKICTHCFDGSSAYTLTQENSQFEESVSSLFHSKED